MIAMEFRQDLRNNRQRRRHTKKLYATGRNANRTKLRHVKTHLLFQRSYPVTLVFRNSMEPYQKRLQSLYSHHTMRSLVFVVASATAVDYHSQVASQCYYNLWSGLKH